MDHIEKISVSIVVVQLLQLLSNGLHDTVSNSNSVVVEACLPRCCMETAVVRLFISRSLPSNGSIRHSIKKEDPVSSWLRTEFSEGAWTSRSCSCPFSGGTEQRYPLPSPFYMQIFPEIETHNVTSIDLRLFVALSSTNSTFSSVRFYTEKYLLSYRDLDFSFGQDEDVCKWNCSEILSPFLPFSFFPYSS
jgi:hypothetical protein